MFGDSYECGGPKCNFNLGYYDDLASCIIEIREEDFKRAQIIEEKNPEQKKTKRERMVCESCQHVNEMTRKLNSCLCIKCKSKNEIIEYMIIAIADTK